MTASTTFSQDVPQNYKETAEQALVVTDDDDDDESLLRANGALTLQQPCAVASDSTVPSSPSPSLCRTVCTILIWYCLSNVIILSTKWLFSNHFPFPLMVTTYSNTLAAVWATLLSCHPKLRPLPLSRQQFTHYVLPIGIMTALEIGCSNFALELLTVSFGTILKGMAPIFTFLWGLAFGLETFSTKICACLITMAAGIALASLGEGQEFQFEGFFLQLFSTCLGGLRWATTHKLLLLEGNNHQSHHMSPLKATLYTAPTTSICVLPVAVLLEGSKVLRQHEVEGGLAEILLILSTMTVIASLVFLLIMSEYWLVGATSSLALSVTGVFKELLTIGAGILFFSDAVDLLNILGFGICQVGILFYVLLRRDSNVAYTPIEGETVLSPPHRQQQIVEMDLLGESRFIDEPETVELSKVRHGCSLLS